ncbi:MAG: ribosome silencing factor [Pseudomonadota bacterium]
MTTETISLDSETLAETVVAALEDAKAQDIRLIDVRHLTSMTDYMVVASGTSDRHVKSVASSVVDTLKAAGRRPLGVEGENDGEWVLVDLQDALVHVMLPRIRDFYNLEKLWDLPPEDAVGGTED